MVYDPNNTFARILRGEIPCVKIYEDTQTLAFMDVAPAVDGHAQVIPKEAAETILDLSPEGAAALLRTTQIVAKAVKKALDCPGIMLAQLNGAAAAQRIPHIHFHVLPRYSGLDNTFHGRTGVDPKALERIAARIRAAL